MFLCDLIWSNRALFHVMCCNHRSARSLGSFLHVDGQSDLALFHVSCCYHRSVRSLGSFLHVDGGKRCTNGAKARATKGGQLGKAVSFGETFPFTGFVQDGYTTNIDQY